MDVRSGWNLLGEIGCNKLKTFPQCSWTKSAASSHRSSLDGQPAGHTPWGTVPELLHYGATAAAKIGHHARVGEIPRPGDRLVRFRGRGSPNGAEDHDTLGTRGLAWPSQAVRLASDWPHQ